jgi:hypothetical protein
VVGSLFISGLAITRHTHRAKKRKMCCGNVPKQYGKEQGHMLMILHAEPAGVLQGREIMHAPEECHVLLRARSGNAHRELLGSPGNTGYNPSF